jgi:hypothetical protein
MPNNKNLQWRVAILSFLFFGGLGSGVSAAQDASGLFAIGSVPCSNILMFQNNPVTQKDVTGWVQKSLKIVMASPTFVGNKFIKFITLMCERSLTAHATDMYTDQSIA